MQVTRIRSLPVSSICRLKQLNISDFVKIGMQHFTETFRIAVAHWVAVTEQTIGIATNYSSKNLHIMKLVVMLPQKVTLVACSVI